MENFNQQLSVTAALFSQRIKRRSDRLMNYFLVAYFSVGLILASFYNTWFIALSVGGLSLLAYYSVKLFLPKSTLYQYVLSGILGVFMAQFIYELHGMFEMHFFAFIGSAILITYQNWKLQLPILFVVLIHHSAFSYLQNSGIDGVYFTSLSYFDLQTFVIHIFLTAVIFFICGLWSFQLNKYNQKHLRQTFKLMELQIEANLSNERRDHAEALKKLNQNLKIKARELAISNTELEQFAHVASHDLQEPLRTITSFLKLLSDRYELLFDEKGKQYINFATNGAQQIKRLFKICSNTQRRVKQKIDVEQINLGELVGDILTLHHERIRERDIKIVIGDLPSIFALKTAIRQVFQNLIGNALKYHHEGSRPVVEISCKDQDTYWDFAISDNGIGIPKDQFDNVFIIFKRLHPQATFPGTGMGLAITKKIIEFIGGEIWIESAENTGTTFHFTIPKHTHTKKKI